MTFSVVATGGRAIGVFIIPPLEKGGEGGFEKANKDRRDMELLIIYKISPDPSLLKRGTQLVSDIFIGKWGRSYFFTLSHLGKFIRK